MKIPKIIHQTWKNKEIPSRFKGYVKSWKKYNPDWQYMLWTDKANREFIKTHYPDFLDLYDSYNSNIKRADAFRYFLLYYYGGLYADLDFECLKPFDELLKVDHTCFLGYEPELHSTRLYKSEKLICNAIMASTKGHRFWDHVFSVLMDCRNKKDVKKATGPMMLEDAVNSYQHEDVSLLPSIVFYPLPDMNNKNLLLTMKEKRYYSDMKGNRTYPVESYAIHHWAGTWYSGGIRATIGRLMISLRVGLIRWIKQVFHLRHLQT